MNLKKLKQIHFTGIKGVGMTALALCCQGLKIKVSGSDTAEIFPTDKILKARKIKIKIGFSPKNLPKNCDLVIYTGAHCGRSNPEVVAALDRKIPVLAQAEALGLLSLNQPTIAVSGVGGKSSTSALIATVLDTAGLKPGFCVGAGNIPALGTPGYLAKKSPYFVVEADEYVTDPQHNLTPRFHYLNPFISVITNLEYDHPDVYKNLADIFASFRRFINRAQVTVINLDNPHNRQFLKTINQPIITYGFSPQADWQILKTYVADKKQFIKLKYKNILWPELILNVPGDYNALNAVAAVAVAHHLGISPQKINSGLQRFSGVNRRFELIASIKGVDLYDDYAHHPSEIMALLKAVKNWLPERRIIAIFQSHTYSRTQALLPEFSQSFTLADTVLINDIFASARETDTLGLTGEIFTQSIKNYHKNVHYCPGETATIDYLKSHLKSGDAIFTIGAGNNWLWHKQIIKLLKFR